MGTQRGLEGRLTAIVAVLLALETDHDADGEQMILVLSPIKLLDLPISL